MEEVVRDMDGLNFRGIVRAHGYETAIDGEMTETLSIYSIGTFFTIRCWIVSKS